MSKAVGKAAKHFFGDSLAISISRLVDIFDCDRKQFDTTTINSPIHLAMAYYGANGYGDDPMDTDSSGPKVTVREVISHFQHHQQY